MSEPSFEMSPAALQDRSERLASLVGELGAALRECSVTDDTASRLLATASTAVLDALTLDLMLDGDPAAPVAAPAVAEPDAESTAPTLPLAA